MKIFFTCSPKKLFELREYYLAIHRSLLSEGHDVVADWLKSGIERHSPTGIRTKISRKEFYQQLERSIEDCGILLVEGTVDSMSLGWQIAKALEKNKKIVFLQIIQEDSPPIHPFIEGVMNESIHFSQYSLENIGEVLATVLKWD